MDSEKVNRRDICGEFGFSMYDVKQYYKLVFERDKTARHRTLGFRLKLKLKI